jgi:glycosyltransferase involved in cell wall biosynthesis
MSNQNMISVGVMGYNQEKFVRQTMDCILAQQCNYAFEIVIGDDCSTDNTRTILEEYQRKYPHIIKLLPREPNKGILRNFRSVMEACTGKYVSFCHCDDFWHDPFKLEKEVNFLENNPEYGFIHTDADVLFHNKHKTIHAFHAAEGKPMPEGDVFEDLLLGKFFVFTGSACFSKEVITRYVNFDEFEKADFMYEDLPTWLELARNVKFKYLPDSTMTYRVMQNSHSNPKEKAKRYILMDAHHKMKMHFIKKYNLGKNKEEAFELQYHQMRFNVAYNQNNFKEANKSFQYLKGHKQAGMKLMLKNTLLRFPVVQTSIKKLKKIYTGDKEFYNQG